MSWEKYCLIFICAILVVTSVYQGKVLAIPEPDESGSLQIAIPVSDQYSFVMLPNATVMGSDLYVSVSNNFETAVNCTVVMEIPVTEINWSWEWMEKSLASGEIARNKFTLTTDNVLERRYVLSVYFEVLDEGVSVGMDVNLEVVGAEQGIQITGKVRDFHNQPRNSITKVYYDVNSTNYSQIAEYGLPDWSFVGVRGRYKFVVMDHETNDINTFEKIITNDSEFTLNLQLSAIQQIVIRRLTPTNILGHVTVLHTSAYPQNLSLSVYVMNNSEKFGESLIFRGLTAFNGWTNFTFVLEPTDETWKAGSYTIKAIVADDQTVLAMRESAIVVPMESTTEEVIVSDPIFMIAPIVGLVIALGGAAVAIVARMWQTGGQG